LAALFAIALAAPEPPTSEFDPNDLMSGKNPDPVLLSRVTGIYTRAGAAAARGGPAAAGGFGGGQGGASSYSPPSAQSFSNARGIAADAAAATGTGDFVIDEIQFAPLIDEFDFNNNNGGGAQAQGRNGGGGYPGQAPPAARSYSPPASGGYPSRNGY
jgi:hypothetical protein